MDNPYAKLALTVGHENLFHRKVSQEEIIEIISQYPASFWLDIFSKIESFLLIKRKQISDPQTYLAKAIFPPSTLSRIERNFAEKEFYFTLGQLNILRKLAILYGCEDGTTEMPPKEKMSKVLLGTQDLSNEYDSKMGKSNDLESFCKFAIRNGYLNNNLNTSFGTLYSRAYRMYVYQATKIAFKETINFIDFFTKHVGIKPEQAMALNFAFGTPFAGEEDTFWNKTKIIDPETYFSNLLIEKEKIDSIIESLVVDFSKVKEKILSEIKDIDFSTSPIGYNLEIFRKTPLVRLPNGKLVCASLQCLFEKATQNIIWMPLKNVDQADERKQLINDLTDYRGQLFEEHLKELCSIFVSKNNKISFVYIPPESTNDHEEVGDSILIQGEDVVIFEAKSRQFNETFKYTGDWEKHDPHFINDLINKSSNQIEKATRKIMEGKIKDFPIDPKNIKHIHPIVVTYDPVPMFGKVQKFIRQKVQEVGHLNSSIFAPFEIINITDLEEIMDSANTHTFIDLLKEKNLSNNLDASEADFHNFFCYFLTTHEVISNGG